MENSTPLPTETTDLIYGWVAIVLYALKLPYALTGVASIPILWRAQPGFMAQYGVTSGSMRTQAIQLLASLFLVAIPGLISGYFMTKGHRSSFVIGLVANTTGFIVNLLLFPRDEFKQMAGHGFFTVIEFGLPLLRFVLAGIIYVAFFLYCTERLTGWKLLVLAKNAIVGHFRPSLD